MPVAAARGEAPMETGLVGVRPPLVGGDEKDMRIGILCAMLRVAVVPLFHMNGRLSMGVWMTDLGLYGIVQEWPVDVTRIQFWPGFGRLVPPRVWALFAGHVISSAQNVSADLVLQNCRMDGRTSPRWPSALVDMYLGYI